ncbi:MAG TPA: sulfotransferase [Chitinophagales bacterium]|nr:sulfotransferase domain-containing protein [Chitinophagales bacterium]HMU68745.1 sulfotransferase [Chitinophagales bacterium]HMX03450.1 sulfotransferase [Chitinophagales bacterium]HMZ88323.1 sulfotransferase [Chitinophagales bacterium]HNA56464.1 sulfotransferase [Chitinophagales bacterium]
MTTGKTILPTFLVVGANKGGTTSIYHYLKQHPEVYLSPIKEPHYFSKDIDVNQFKKEFAHNKLQDIEKYVQGDMKQEFHAAFVRSEEQYLKLFKNVTSQKAIGELSTSYLYSTVAATEIKKLIPNCKIIICLRNPIERAYSHYRMNLWTGNSNEFDFHKALLEDYQHQPKVWGNAHLYTEIGMYYQQVKRYLDTFGAENVKVIFTEDLKKNSAQVIRDLYTFIGVDPSFNPDTSTQYNEVYTPKYKNLTWFLNKSGIRPFMKRISPKFLKGAVVKLFYKQKADKGQMPPAAKSFLLEKLGPDVHALESLLNKDLSGWLK